MIAPAHDTHTQHTHTAPRLNVPTLKRSAPRQHKHRPTFWYDRADGRLLAEDGSPLVLPERHELADVLNAIAHTPSPTDHYTLWILGGDKAANTPDRAWFTAPVTRHWELSNYQGGKAEDASGRAAQYSAAHSTIDVRLVASWFANVADLDTARRGYLRLWQVLRSAFGSSALILPTPAMTGLELLQQNLPFGREYPQIADPDLMRMLWAMPQGRIELYTDRAEQHINADLETLDGLYNLDGVFMYAATLKELPVGRMVDDTVPLVWEHAPGFYEVTAQVPADWAHVGLLPHREGDKVYYPWRRGHHCSPNGWFATFVTSAELQLAIRHGWRVRISRRYVWPDKQGDPLRGWADRIKATREAWAMVPDPLAPLVRDGLRHILLDPLGAFHRHQTFAEGFVAYGHEDDIPEDAYHIHREEHGISYYVPATPSRYHQTWMHPEWSATAWGRTRARGAGEMLKHPADSLVAYRVDGVWMTHDPGYAPSTHAGAWRLKYAIERPVKAPHDTAAMLRLIRLARASAGGLD